VDRRTFGKATVVAFAGLGLRSTLPLTPAFGAPPTFADSFPQAVDGVLQEPAGILYQEAEDGFLPGGADGQVKSGLVTPDLDFTGAAKVYVVVQNLDFVAARQGFRVKFYGPLSPPSPLSGVTLACGQPSDPADPNSLATLASIGLKCVHTRIDREGWAIQVRDANPPPPGGQPPPFQRIHGGKFASPLNAHDQFYTFEHVIEDGIVTLYRDGEVLGSTSDVPPAKRQEEKVRRVQGRGCYFECSQQGAGDFTRLDRIWASDTV